MRKTILSAALALAFSSLALAQPSAIVDEAAKSRDPLKVNAREMVTDKKANTIVFRGDVVAVRGTLTIRTDNMTVYTDKDQREFRKILAKGSVRISREDKLATGEEAEYFNDNPARGEEERIEIKGNAHLKDGRNNASGEKVVYFFKTGDMKIFGQAGITIFPESGSPGEAESHAPSPSIEYSSQPAPAPAQETAGARYLVQAASDKEKKEAERLMARLAGAGYRVFIEEALVKGAMWYRVRLGDFGSPEEAEKAAERLRDQYGLKPIVIMEK